MGKIKDIAYIYIHFYAEFDEKSCIKAKIESRKCLHAVFLLTPERRYWRHNAADVQSNYRVPWYSLTSITDHVTSRDSV